MLKITIMPNEHFDEETEKFFYFPDKEIDLILEHSLLSITRWEEKWHIPFPFINNTSDKMTEEQVYDYIRFMCVKPAPDQISIKLLKNLSQEQVSEITDYINNPMTATFFRDKKAKPGNKKIITNELIYYYMSAYQIPFSCEKWHFNRLMTLIRVCNAETEAQNPDNKKKGFTKSDYADRARLNAMRKAKAHTRG